MGLLEQILENQKRIEERLEKLEQQKQLTKPADLIPIAEVKRLFNVTAETLKTWHNKEILLQHKSHEKSRKIFYRRSEVEAHLQNAS